MTFNCEILGISGATGRMSNKMGSVGARSKDPSLLQHSPIQVIIFMLGNTQNVCYRAYEAKYATLMYIDFEEIFLQTGCQKPCTYKKYTLSGDKQAIFENTFS